MDITTQSLELPAGAVLLEAGSPPGFVYIPMATGLMGTPLGGYQAFPLTPWVPLGTTGVSWFQQTLINSTRQAFC